MQTMHLYVTSDHIMKTKLTFVGPSEGDQEGPTVGPIEGDFVGDEDGEVVG